MLDEVVGIGFVQGHEHLVDQVEDLADRVVLERRGDGVIRSGNQW